MARLKLLLAFALGWLSVAAVQFAADAAANAATAGAATQPGSVTWRIAALHESVNVMEKAAAAGKFVRRAMAPFEVVNRAGQRLFYVTPEREVEFYQGRKRAAVMSAAGGVGTLWALSSTQTSAALTGTELTMKENDRLRVALGKDAGYCNYRLQFASSAIENVAAIGLSWETKGGAALVFDAGGTLRADMTAAGDYRGNVAVLAGAGHPLGILTQSGGGYLVLCSAASCQPPLVEAMDAGGYGHRRKRPQRVFAGRWIRHRCWKRHLRQALRIDHLKTAGKND